MICADSGPQAVQMLVGTLTVPTPCSLRSHARPPPQTEALAALAREQDSFNRQKSSGSIRFAGVGVCRHHQNSHTCRWAACSL